MMAGRIILLLPLLITYSFAEMKDSKYSIQYSCKNLVCFQVWKPAGIEMAIGRNGQIRAATSEAGKSKCILPINPITDEDVGRHHCRRNPLINPCGEDKNCATTISYVNTGPINMLPKQKVSLQCVLLSSLDSTCLVHIYGFLAVQWVDENGETVQENSEFQITKNSPCDVTLTITFQSPQSATFRCMAAVNNQEWTSTEIQVRLLAPKGKGRVAVIDINKPQPGGVDRGVQTDQSNQVVGPTVGVLGAVVVMAAVVYVVNKRRTNTRLSNESYISTANHVVLDSDEVIYADVILPPTSDRMYVSEYEPTEYACVRYS